MARDAIPLAALDSHVGVVGKTGSGKSYATQGIVEDLIEKRRRVCIIDPTDRYWGLRLLADGKNRSGYEPVIFGGMHGDLPLAPTHGAAIAEVVGTTTTPVIISMRQLKVSERTRFFTDFAETLLRKNEGPLHLVIDEAHLFAPQGGAKVGGGAPDMLHAANNLVSLGRGIGLRIMLISQRPAKLHKDSLTQVETLVAFRLIAPQDRNAIKEWVKEWADEATGAEMMSTLPSLPTGTAWVWAPELDVLKKAAFPANSTFDSGQPPKAGKKGPELAPIDLAKVGAQLETVAKEAIENDPRRLKSRIAELERSLAKGNADPVKAKADRDAAYAAGAAAGEAKLEGLLDQAHAEGYGKGAAEAAAAALRRIEGYTEDFAQIRDRALGALDGLQRWREEGAKAPQPQGRPPARTQPSRPPPRPMPPRRPAPSPRVSKPPAGDGQQLSRPQQRILDALAWLKSLGIDRGDRVRVAMLADQSPRSSGYEKNISTLKTAGLIEYPGAGELALTAEGEGQASPPEFAPTDAALHDMIRRHVSGPQWRILEALIRTYPDALSRESLAEAADQSALSSGFEKNVSTLRSLGFVEYPDRGHVAAQPVLFINGG